LLAHAGPWKAMTLNFRHRSPSAPQPSKNFSLLPIENSSI
jgi:hypothetical protein